MGGLKTAIFLVGFFIYGNFQGTRFYLTLANRLFFVSKLYESDTNNTINNDDDDYDSDKPGSNGLPGGVDHVSLT